MGNDAVNDGDISFKREIIIIGGGFVGVLSAWFLSEFKSNKVTVIESSPGIAMKTSFLNGGLLCPSLTYPWSNASSILSFAKSLWSGDGFVSVSFEALKDFRFYRWAGKFLLNTFEPNVTENYRKSHLLAQHSMQVMAGILPFDQYKRTSQGSLQLFFSKQSQEQMHQRMELMEGCKTKLLSKEECLSMEPSLAADRPFIGGIYSSSDSSGDIFLFTKALQQKCLSNGVEFRFNTEIESFVQDQEGKAVVYCVTQTGERIYADDVVICAGNGSPALGSLVGDVICSYPVQGYALEVPTTLPLKYNVTDEISKLYSSPLGDSIRISGITRLNPPNAGDEIDKSLADKLLDKVRPFFKANFMDESNLKIHTCFRPQTPDDLPIIGKGAKMKNVWYNCGHGHLGFTRGVGSANLLCSLVMGQQAPIPVEPYSPLRFNS